MLHGINTLLFNLNLKYLFLLKITPASYSMLIHSQTISCAPLSTAPTTI